MSQYIKLDCPVCKKPAKREFINFVNTQQDPQLKLELLSGNYFSFECDQCGAKRQMNYEFIYLDPERKLLFIQLPDHPQNPERLQEILTKDLADQPYQLQDFIIRLVYTSAELIEKIQIFDAGQQDACVEMVKVLTDGLFAQEHPDNRVRGRYFYPQSQSYKLLYITDKDPILTDYHPKLVDFIQTKYAKILDQLPLGECLLINSNWAYKHLDKKQAKEVNEAE